MHTQTTILRLIRSTERSSHWKWWKSQSRRKAAKPVTLASRLSTQRLMFLPSPEPTARSPCSQMWPSDHMTEFLDVDKRGVLCPSQAWLLKTLCEPFSFPYGGPKGMVEPRDGRKACARESLGVRRLAPNTSTGVSHEQEINFYYGKPLRSCFLSTRLVLF